MNVMKVENDNDLIEKAIKILDDKFGHINTMRFISLAINKRVDSVSRHRNYEKQLNKEDYFQCVFPE